MAWNDRVEIEEAPAGERGDGTAHGKTVADGHEGDIEAAAALAAQGLAGWLATLDGNYWSRRRLILAPVQMLGDGTTLDWPVAIIDFEAARQRALRPL